jgi:hypothetical protein
MKHKVILLDENRVFVGSFKTHFDAVMEMISQGIHKNWYNVSSGLALHYGHWHITKDDSYPMVGEYPFSTYIDVEDEDGYCTLKVLTKSEEDAEIVKIQVETWRELEESEIDFIYFV